MPKNISIDIKIVTLAKRAKVMDTYVISMVEGRKKWNLDISGLFDPWESIKKQ